MLRRVVFVWLMAFALLSSSFASPSDSAGPTTLGRTPWQVFATPTYVPNPDSATIHGNIPQYAAAPAIPSQNDSGWKSCGPTSPIRNSPYSGPAPLCPNDNTVGMSVGSRLPGCWSNLDFTLFQTLISVPTGATITQFSVNLSGADDGARITIINSANPGGLVVAGSYIFLGGSQSTSNLAPYVVAGEVNRVIVTQVDDCAVGNNLGSASVTLNGSVVVVTPPDPTPAAPPFSQGAPAPPGALQCTPLLMNNQGGPNGSAAQHWFVKSAGTSLAIDVTAVTVNNTTESGSINAKLFDGATQLASVSPVHPNTLGAGNTATLAVSGLTAGNVYRLQVEAGPAVVPGTGPARHYRLRTAAANAVGTGGGLFNYEGGTARWGVNVNPSEELRVRVADSNVDTLSGTARLVTPTLVTQPSVSLASPGTDLVVGASATVGQWLAAIDPQHHYSLSKTSGTDQGVYLSWLTAGMGSLTVAVTGQPVTLTLTNLEGQSQVASFAPGSTTFSLPVGPYTVTSAPQAPGTYQVTPVSTQVNITCDGSAQLSFEAINQPPTVTLNAPAFIPEGTTVNVGALANDPEGGPLTVVWTLTGPGTLNTTGPVTYTNGDGPGVATVTVTVTDNGGLTATASRTIETRNVPPTLTAGADQTQYWGLPVPLTVVSVTDPSPQDTTAGFTVDWHFGDPPSASPDQSGLNLLTTSHTYALPGSYTVKVAATDKDGGRGPQSADSIGVSITKRTSALTCTGSTQTFGSVLLSAQLSDTVQAASAILGGNAITYTIGGATYSASTGATGSATANVGAALLPGTYTVAVAFAGNNRYDAAAGTCSVTVASTAGKVTAGTLRSINNGRGGFNAQSDGTTVKGELEFQNNAVNFHAHTLTALSVSADGTKAWFAGIGTNGQAFTAYVEDNGEPGRTDVFKLWIAGVPQNGDGALTGGNVQIHK